MVKIQLCITGINSILKYIKIEKLLFQIVKIISQNNSFFFLLYFFDQMNSAWLSIMGFFQKHLKTLLTRTSGVIMSRSLITKRRVLSRFSLPFDFS